MTSVSAKALRAASIVICLIVATSFLLFAINQTSNASGRQQEELGSKAPAAQTAATTTTHESGFRKGLDEVSEELTSPVSGLTSSASEWGARGLRLIFALLVYGFALGYIARVIRVRA
ncbi:MAG TPA: hypothetical protein VF927_03940 [Solirubrobacteraceae bacterium]